MLSWITPVILRLLTFWHRPTSNPKSFMGRALAGEFDDRNLAEVMDCAIDAWHLSDSTLNLHEYLGLTWKEYASWVEGRSSIDELLRSREFLFFGMKLR